MSNANLVLRNVRKTYSSSHGVLEAISSVSLDVAPGSFTVIVGPSGCGKSTLLQIAAGLASATDGDVALNGTRVTAPPPDAIYVFQQYSKSVFPWKTVRNNIMFGLRYRRFRGTRLSAEEADRRCERILELVGLTAFAHYHPHQLSGGMQQRVAIARALVCEPDVLLMDEPFSAVDALTRTELQDGLLELWMKLRPTVIFVTHDIDEAIYLAEQVVVLTRAPARVSQRIEIDLPYPRDQIGTREDARYLSYRRRILADIMGAS